MKKIVERMYFIYLQEKQFLLYRCKARFFLISGFTGFFFRSRVGGGGGTKKINKKAFFFLFFFKAFFSLFFSNISRKTVKLIR